MICAGIGLSVAAAHRDTHLLPLAGLSIVDATHKCVKQQVAARAAQRPYVPDSGAYAPSGRACVPSSRDVMARASRWALSGLRSRPLRPSPT